MATSRRSATISNKKSTMVNGTNFSPFELSPNDKVPMTSPSTDSSIEQEYRSQKELAKVRHWKESEYAAGLVEPTWYDELERSPSCSCCCCGSSPELGQLFQEEIEPGCGCIYLSAAICSRVGAGRIGNMAVLKERYVLVEVEGQEDEIVQGDEEQGLHRLEQQEQLDGFVEEDLTDDPAVESSSTDMNHTLTKRLIRRREIQFIVGPFWPILLFVTYPLIFGVSLLTVYNGLPGRPLYVKIIWALLTAQLILSLFNTGFRDPGILRRYKNPPPVVDNEEHDSSRKRISFRWGTKVGPWRWSEQAQSYRPCNSSYDTDCKVIVEEFDHTCPWTGTAIGKKNMTSFQCFVSLVFICLIMDIFLLTAGSPRS